MERQSIETRGSLLIQMTDKNQDTLGAELRAAELEIDSAYKSNLLIELPYTTAAWTLLATAEELYLQNSSGLTSHESLLFINNLQFSLKYTFIWLKSSCPAGGAIPTKLNPTHRDAAMDLLHLALDYKRFYTAFTYASRGLCRLKIEGDRIEQTPLGRTGDAFRYEAYNILAAALEGHLEPDNDSDLIQSYQRRLSQLIEENITIKGENFKIKADVSLVRLAAKYLNLFFSESAQLPDDWRCSRYSLGEFKQVHLIVCALGFIQQCAHIQAHHRGCPNSGFASGLYVVEKNTLILKVIALMKSNEMLIEFRAVAEILNDLTLWSNNLGLKQTEPVLQPMIRLDRKSYAIAPFLWLGSAAERNWAVLMNAITSEKAVYSELVNEKEPLMKKRIADSLPARYRTGSFKIPGRPDLPDVDLAIVDDLSKVYFIAELKWFINPAEVREVTEKSEEIEKGISQLLKIKEALAKDKNLLNEPLAISAEYRMEILLISANWIGYEWVQNSEVPVINEAHFIKKITGSSSLGDIAAWLKERRYLPVENTHYTLTNNTAVLRNWNLSWRGVETLSDLNV